MALPRVTEVLKDCGLIDTRWFTPAAAEKGTIIHRACELYCLGALDESTVDVSIAPHLESWKRLLDAGEFIPIAVEEHRDNTLYGFQGTYDRGLVRGSAEWLVDIKSGWKMAWHQVQLAAYEILHGSPVRRGGVYLQADGSIAKLEEYRDRKDRDIFLAALAIYQFKHKNGGNVK